MYQGGAEIRTVPGSLSNTKRNSIAANLNDNSSNMHSTGMKSTTNQHSKETRLLRNSDQFAYKQPSRHKRKNAGLGSGQQSMLDTANNQFDSDKSTQNYSSKLRTSSGKN